MAQKEIKALIAAIIVLLGIIGFGGYKYHALSKTNDGLQSNIVDKNKAIDNLQFEKTSLTDALTAEQTKNTSFEEEIDRLSTKVGGLVKLSKIDPEILQKYSKVFFLSDNYAPARLSEIDSDFALLPDRQLEFITQGSPFLRALLLKADKADLNLKVSSAYRSFETQANVKSGYKVIYGAGTANQFSADQGYSEHQLGTAVDFSTPTIGPNLTGFEKTPEYTWLLDNAYTYGFVMSYPPNNQYYIYEPWHWRFVGIELATDLHDTHKFFYELDQRAIDKYLAKIFDN